MLWNRNFSLLVAANVLLYAAVYLLYPLLHRWLVGDGGLTPLQAGGVCALFAPAMFLLGAFNNYWVDHYARKAVAERSLLAIALASLLYPYAGSPELVGALRVVQGAAFGVAVMATGATLAIDVTPGDKRTPANRVFAWSSILGAVAGLVTALVGAEVWRFHSLLYLSAGLCLGAVLLVSMVEVCFRAPLDVPHCSFDRFLLFRSVPAGGNMLVVPFVLGILAVAVPDIFFYLCTAAGFIGYLLFRQVYTRLMHGRLQVLLGQSLVIGGVLAMLSYPGSRCVLYLAAGCVGLGSGFSVGQFLRMMILLPRHCERASGFQTYLLLWEVGIVLGAWAAFVPAFNPFALSFMAAVAGLLLYQLYLHDYFERHVEA